MNSQGYMHQLDGLRGLAVISVLVSHFGLGQDFNGLAKALPWGTLGVKLFFVLSGFLITRILIFEKENIENQSILLKQALIKFYLRRALRIFPVYYLVIILCIFFDYQNFSDVAWRHSLYISNFYSTMWTDVGGNVGLRHASSAHFWSLSVEEQFYLLWPLTIFCIPKRWLPYLAVVMMLIAPLWRLMCVIVFPEYATYWGGALLPSALDTLGAGALLACYSSGLFTVREKYERYIKSIVYISALMFMVYLVLYLNKDFRKLYFIFADFVYAVLCMVLISAAAVGENKFLGKILLWSPINYIGKISYGVYIYHAFTPHVINYMLALFGAALLTEEELIKYNYIFTIVIAYVSWRLIELPLIRLKDKLPDFKVDNTYRKT